MAKKKCLVCGEDGFMYYPYCKKHLDEKKNKESNESVEKTNYYTDTKKYKEIEQQEEKENTNGKCIICGKETNSYLFCKTCYYKYKDKEVLIKITKCNDIEILDDSYEGRYTCKDGHIVKSKSEREIDNYLFENNIPHAYELAFPIDNNEEHDLHPDFTLRKFNNGKDVYIEHWGYDENNIKYTKTKKYKIPIYKEKKVTLICTNEKDMKDIEVALKRKLEYYKPNEINE